MYIYMENERTVNTSLSVEKIKISTKIYHYHHSPLVICSQQYKNSLNFVFM